MIPIPWGLAGSWLLSWWRETIIVALVAFGVAQYRGRERATFERGELAGQQRVLRAQVAGAETTSAQLRRQLAAVDRVLVRDTLRVTTWLTRVDTLEHWRHDTAYVAGDTVPRLAVPVSVVVANDSARAACSDLLSSCSRFRAYAVQRFAADSSTMAGYRATIAIAPAPKSCVVPAMLSGGISAISGFVAGRWLH